MILKNVTGLTAGDQLIELAKWQNLYKQYDVYIEKRGIQRYVWKGKKKIN